MLKQLRADGFVTTLFERRSRVGGLWAFSEDENHTTALPSTFLCRHLILLGWLERADTIIRNTRQYQQIHVWLQ